jgi:glycerophosphoryl diester phosphodiesterase
MRMLGGPIVIAHRGACGYRPEHTIEGYRLAIRMGADFIEPDLVSTRDGVLVARHENEISCTTDVADHAEFADRFTTKTIESEDVSGWFTEDFDLDELKTLRAKERLPAVRPRNARYDGRFEVPTFDEILDLVRLEGRRRGVMVGVAAETKNPSYFASIGLALERPLGASLKRHRLHHPKAPVFVQSFEPGHLYDLGSWLDVPLVQLVDMCGPAYDLLVSRGGVAEIASYADVISVSKEMVLPRLDDGTAGTPSGFVDEAHSAGVDVHVWTLRAENRYMATSFRRGSEPTARGHASAEALAFFDSGVDGVVTDHTDTALAARHEWLERYGDRAV